MHSFDAMREIPQLRRGSELGRASLLQSERTVRIKSQIRGSLAAARHFDCQIAGFWFVGIR